jgi:hypothetical protein
VRQRARLRRIEKAIGVIDEEIPLAPVTLSEYGFLLGGQISPAEVVARCRQRWLAGGIDGQRDWPDLPEWLDLRDWLLAHQRDRMLRDCRTDLDEGESL